MIGTDPLGNHMLEGMIYDPTTNATAANGQVYRTQFPGNIIPLTRFDPVAAKIQELFPQPSGPTPAALTNNYLNTYDSNRVTEIPSVKIDQTDRQQRETFVLLAAHEDHSSNGITISAPSDGLPDPLTTALGDLPERSALPSELRLHLSRHRAAALRRRLPQQLLPGSLGDDDGPNPQLQAQRSSV